MFYQLNLAENVFYQEIASQVELLLFNVLNRYNYILPVFFRVFVVNGPYKTGWFPYQLNLADRIGQRKDSDSWLHCKAILICMHATFFLIPLKKVYIIKLRSSKGDFFFEVFFFL